MERGEPRITAIQNFEEVESAENFPNGLSEMELLGLDQPVFELFRKNQVIEVPKIVQLLYQDQDVLRNLIRYFNLNVEEDFFGDKPPKIQRTVEETYQQALLYLLGVKRDIMVQLSTIDLRYPTDLLREKKKGMDMLRQTYAFRHLDEFPEIKASLAKIKELSKLDALQLFKVGKVPPTFSWHSERHVKDPSLSKKSKSKASLEMYLAVIAEALEGQKTAAMIGEDLSIPTHFVGTNILRSPSLSEELVKVLAKKRKFRARKR